jgi:hypothetical protein
MNLKTQYGTTHEHSTTNRTGDAQVL